jgi:uncharacterized protein
MSSQLRKLVNKGLVNVEPWLPDNVMHEVITGSVSYGVSSDTSDMDVVGIAIPPKDHIFPHLRGEIVGFGSHAPVFDEFEKHHIKDVGAEKEYDLKIYSIIKYFQLCMECNPNMIDTLFVPQNCILHTTRVGQMIREGRHLFLSKKAWHTFKGYAYSQLHKMNGKDLKEGSKRALLRDKFGFDVKHAYNVVRLLDEVEQLLTTGDMDIQRANEKMKAVRRGEVPQAKIVEDFYAQERALEHAYHQSKLPWGPDEGKIKDLLLACLEEHYGNLSNCYVKPDAACMVLREIADVIQRNRGIIWN